MRVVGIDPGLTGGICLYNTGINKIFVRDMPVVDGRVNPYEFEVMLWEWGEKRLLDLIAIEAQQAMPKQGVSSSFKTGMNYGMLLGVLSVHRYQVLTVAPSKWTADLRAGRDKDHHRRMAMEFWPQSAQLFSRKKDDGRADAALIARWASAQVTMTRTG